MSIAIDHYIKRWTVKRNIESVLDIIQGKRRWSKLSVWQGRLEKDLRAGPQDARDQYVRKLKDRRRPTASDVGVTCVKEKQVHCGWTRND